MSAPDLEEMRSLTAQQVSELTGIKVKTLYAWRSRGRDQGQDFGPPSFNVGRVVLYPLSGLRTWLDEQKRVAS